MIQLIIQSIYFLMPSYFANMAPVVAAKINILSFANKPIDNNIKIDNRPLFGRNKTYRGFIVGIIMGIVIAYLQAFLHGYSFFREISVVNYSNPLLIGFLLGFGAMLGDLIESFFKRRLNREAGQRFVPFDQVDFILGAFIVAYPFYPDAITVPIVIVGLIASFFLHIVTNHISYYLKIRKEKW